MKVKSLKVNGVISKETPRDIFQDAQRKSMKKSKEESLQDFLEKYLRESWRKLKEFRKESLMEIQEETPNPYRNHREISSGCR